MLDALKARLVISHWRDAFRRYSVRLALGVGTLSAIVAANQSLALSLLNSLPANSFSRILVAIVIGVLVFVVPTLTVLWKQNPPPHG